LETRREASWNAASAWETARSVIEAAAGVDIEAELAAIEDPIERARRAAQLAAPADIKLTLALTHGTTLDALESRRGAARLVGELAVRRLGIVGLRAGMDVDVSLSQRFQDSMGRFFGPAALPADVIDADPDDPAPSP